MPVEFTPRLGAERTLALVKPDAYGKTDEILQLVLQSGFTVAGRRELKVQPACQLVSAERLSTSSR